MTAKILIACFSFLAFISEPQHSEPPKDTLLSVNPGLIIWTMVIFVLLLLILKKWAWKPLLSSLDNRERMIKESVDRAEHLRTEAERLMNENKKLLEKAEDESRRIISEGKEYAEKLRNELLGKTHEDSERLITQAKAEIEREKQNALSELRDEVANLAILAAGKILDENLDENKNRKIVEKFIENL
jgi:F-type H+-transporting ATPase subunit b